MLYIISTPIGNLGDITLRGLKTIENCDYILAEDTRRTAKLLNHYNLKKALFSYNKINENKKTQFVIQDLLSGKNIGLVSDSGTPLISDPGSYLIRECIKNNIPLSPIPGASAAIAALTCSGMPTDRFTFYGFVPKKTGKRKNIFSEIVSRGETAILYESPHRLLKTLKELSEAMPEKQIAIAREMTKKFEEFIKGNPKEVIEMLSKKSIKGEIVIIIN